MKHLVIIGGGGMGKDIYHSAKHSIGYGTEYDIKGFIDDNLNSLDGCEGYPPVLDTIKNYQPSEDDVFTCSIGNVKTKRTLCEMIKDRGGKFITLLHETAQLGENVKLGDGCIIDSHAHIGSDTISCWRRTNRRKCNYTYQCHIEPPCSSGERCSGSCIKLCG